VPAHASIPVTIDPRYHDAVLFDLDGVVTDTASAHAAAWKSVLDSFSLRVVRGPTNATHHSPMPTIGASSTANPGSTVGATSCLPRNFAAGR
jgi:hypothetical protein